MDLLWYTYYPCKSTSICECGDMHSVEWVRAWLGSLLVKCTPFSSVQSSSNERSGLKIHTKEDHTMRLLLHYKAEEHRLEKLPQSERRTGTCKMFRPPTAMENSGLQDGKLPDTRRGPSLMTSFSPIGHKPPTSSQGSIPSPHLHYNRQTQTSPTVSLYAIRRPSE